MKDIENKLKKIKDDEFYKPSEIALMGFITDSNGKPARHKIFRLIHSGLLVARNVSSGKLPHYSIKGSDLRKFVEERFNINK